MPCWPSCCSICATTSSTGSFFHRLSHNVRWLWLLHAVHHSDAAVDVTTNLRQHPLHILVTQGWKLLVAAAVGVPMWVFLLHETLAIGMAHLHHAAIRWPRWIDIAFAWFEQRRRHRGEGLRRETVQRVRNDARAAQIPRLRP
jgi:sterol desaturase/sphingolipid hydroxylase (fatty acid hydroxylase superfamily)